MTIAVDLGRKAPKQTNKYSDHSIYIMDPPDLTLYSIIMPFDAIEIQQI